MTSVEYRGDTRRPPAERTLWWRARQPFVPAAKAALRAVGMATAAERTLPDFLLIGAKRGGSTSLHRNLLASPGVTGLYPPRADIKGTYYFDVEYRRGPRWYRSHFPTPAERRAAVDTDGTPALAGEASPYYLSHPHAAARAAALVPDAKIVVALRDPVDRALSHYRERVAQGLEDLPSFADAVAAEPARLDGEVERMLVDPAHVSGPHLNHGYLAQSEYDIGLARWLDAFGAERVHVIRSEDYYADERAVLGELRAFLGLCPVELPAPRHYNATGPPELDPGLARELQQRLTPSVRRLEALLDRSFDWF